MASSIPQTMRAVVQEDLSKYEVTFNPSANVPEPKGDDEHLVKVSYTSPTLNELNWPLFNPEAWNAKPYAVPCYDFSGTVVASPSPSSPFRPGTKVFARISAYTQGAAAEYVIARTHELALLPEGLEMSVAAGVPMSAETAWQFLFDAELGGAKHGRGILNAKAITEPIGSIEQEAAANFNASKRVLVTGAAGGVGLWMVQLAAAAGARVIAVVRGEGKTKLASELGALEVLDTNILSLAEWAAAEPTARKADLVLDCVGGQLLAQSWGAVKDNGMLYSIVMPPEMVKPQEGGTALDGVKNEFFIVEPEGGQLAHVGKLLSAGKCRQPIDSVFELGDAGKAFEKVEKAHPTGKVLIKVARDI